MRIGSREIGPDSPCFVIAELSANHRGSLEIALELVDAAGRAGADAVKLQTYTADTITLDSDAEPFRIQSGTLWDGQTLHELYSEAMTPWEWYPELAARAAKHGMECFSSPFDPTAIEFLESHDTPAYKIASFELVDLGLIAAAAATGKPLIMSTGMASLEEIEEAVTAARAAGAKDLALLSTSSAYPAPPSSINLRRIPDLAERFGVAAGFSDHTIGIAAPVAAVGLGASIIEKHLCLARADGGPDAEFSLEPEEFAEMVAAVRVAEQALGTADYSVRDAEGSSRAFRRSLFVVADVAEGEELSAENVRSIRPAGGLHTRHLGDVLGRRAATAIPRGTPLSWDLVEGGE